MSNTATHIPRIGIWLLIALLPALNVARIFLIPATYDEVAFFRLFHHSYADIVTFKAIVSANVHPLSFVITKFFTGIFSNHIFFLRLGSLLAQLLYLAYTYKLVKHLFSNTWWQLAAMILLHCNPFLFDFWALNRGYGMAIAFMSMSIFYFLQFTTYKRSLPHLAVGLIASGLACYGNFALLHYYIGSLLAMAILLLPSLKTIPKKILLFAPLITLTITGLLYAIVFGPIQALKVGKQLYHGGSTGFYTDTVKTLVKECLLTTDANATPVIICSILTIAILAANLVYTILYTLKNIRSTTSSANSFLLLITLCTAGSVIIQFYANNTLLLTDRTALFFYVLVLLTLCTWLYSLPSAENRSAPFIIIGLLSALFIVRFSFRLSLRSTWQWAFDQHNITVLERMKKTYKGKKIQLGPSWLFEPTMNYYILTQYTTYFDTVVGIAYPIAAKDTTRDYYYIPADEQKEIPANYMVDTALTVENTNAYYGKFLLLKRAGR